MTTLQNETCRHDAATASFVNGEGGIRTPERLAPLLVFETSTIDHSVTSPGRSLRKGDWCGKPDFGPQFIRRRQLSAYNPGFTEMQMDEVFCSSSAGGGDSLNSWCIIRGSCGACWLRQSRVRSPWRPV